jgi:hypothetical protein
MLEEQRRSCLVGFFVGFLAMILGIVWQWR